MANKGSAAGKRAKKKHEKKQKRAQKQARARRAGVDDKARPPLRRWNPKRDGVQGLADTAWVPLYEAARDAVDLAQELGAAPPELWSVARVRALSTEDITQRLATLGIDASPARVAKAFSGSWVTYELASEEWVPWLAKSASVHDRDFVCIAACELRARHFPDEPFREELVDRFLDAEEALEQQEPARAVSLWLSFWQRLRQRLGPGVLDIGTLDALLELARPFLTFVDQLARAAHEIVDDEPARAAEVATALGDISAALPLDDDDARALLEDRVELYARAGRSDEAAALVDEAERAAPDSAAGMVLRAIAVLGADDDALPQALALLEEASARGFADADAWRISARIEAIRGALASGDASGSVSVAPAR